VFYETEENMMSLLLVFILIIAGLYGISRSKRNFRRMLAGELSGWVEAGIITPDQAAQLEGMYQLDQLPEESQITLLKTLFMFGAALIALGIISFVAANWDLIPKHCKWILITLAMVGSHGAGYRLWKVKNSSPYLGHALIILGTLIFGADIALIGQIFHLPGEYHHGLLLWSLGALGMGYAVQSVPHLLMAIGASFGWFVASVREPSFGTFFYLMLLPAAVLPYAYRYRSRGTHFGLVLAWVIGTVLYLSTPDVQLTAFWLVSGVSAIAAGLWGYGDMMAKRGNIDFGDDSKISSAFILSVLGYILTFQKVIEGMIADSIHWPSWEGMTVWALLCIGAMGLVTSGYYRNSAKEEKSDYLVVCLGGIVCAVVGLFQGSWAVIAGIVTMNILVILFGGYFFWKGVSSLDRRYFWLGLALLIIVVVSRFFEYDTGLLWKSVSFILAGIGLIYGGILFEKKRGGVLKDGT